MKVVDGILGALGGVHVRHGCARLVHKDLDLSIADHMMSHD